MSYVEQIMILIDILKVKRPLRPFLLPYDGEEHDPWHREAAKTVSIKGLLFLRVGVLGAYLQEGRTRGVLNIDSTSKSIPDLSPRLVETVLLQ